MSADLYTHGCMQSSSKLLVFSMRVISKKGFARQQVKLYPQHRAGSLGSAPGKVGVESTSQACWLAAGGTFRLAPVTALSAQICSPNACAHGVASARGSKLRITAILKEMLLMVAR